MLNKLLVAFAAGMLSFSTPLNAESAETPGTLPVVSETTIPSPASLMQQAVVRTEIPTAELEAAPARVAIDPQTECIATAMYYEAKGEPLAGKRAVGYVILNRVQTGKWKPTPCGVVTQKAQFSWYRPGTIGNIPTNLKNTYLALASSVINTYSRANDPSNGATHFHAKWVNPHWRGVTRLLSIGGHVFYRQRGVSL